MGSYVSIGAKYGLMHDVDDRKKFFGLPARPAREQMKIIANQSKLPEMRKQLKEIAKQIESIKNESDSVDAIEHSDTSVDSQAA